eukprot:contig_11080_g2645
MKEMREYVAKHVPRLASSSAAVDRAQLTGNITAEQRELAAAAYFERRNLYDAIYDDANEQQTAADLHVDQRAATWLSSWRILKDMDKFSGAAGMSAGDGESLDGILTEPSTEVAAEAPVSTAVTSGAGTMVVPMSPATPPATPPTTPAEQAPAATPDAVNVHVADVIDVVDLVEIEDDEEMPCTPPAVLSPRTKRRRFVESRDGQ